MELANYPLLFVIEPISIDQGVFYPLGQSSLFNKHYMLENKNKKGDNMNSFKKVLSAVLAIIMIVSCCAFSVSADDTAGIDVWDGTADTKWYYEAIANENTNFIITTAEQLAGFAALVNDGDDFSGKTVTLKTDVIWNTGDASHFATTVPSNVWTPIKEFKGTFDGDGHAISGLYFKNTSISNVGLFAKLNGATVENVSVVNSYFAANRLVGAIAGLSEGKASTIKNCYSDAIIFSNTSENKSFAGGILGQGTVSGIAVENCWFAGSITAQTVINNDNVPRRARMQVTQTGIHSEDVVERIMLTSENSYNAGSVRINITNGKLDVEMPAKSAAIFRRVVE